MRKESTQSPSFHFWWSHTSEHKIQRSPGFQLSWWVENKTNPENSSSVPETFVPENATNPARSKRELGFQGIWPPEKASPWKPNNAKWSLVNLVQTSRLEDKTEDLRITTLKQRWGLDNLKSSPCLNDVAITEQIDQIKTKLNLDYKEYDWIPDEDLEVGLELYSYLHYCQSQVVEAAQLSVFFEALLSNHRFGTLVASTMNNIQPRVGHNLLDLTPMNMWFEHLDEKLNFSLGPLLIALSTTKELKRLKVVDPPFLRRHTDIMDLCIQKNDCEGLLQSTGIKDKYNSKLICLIER